jgi:BirA family biotin operon repressor/biotin-[acetyl-CoA-carboxylase] ligase
MAGPPDTLVESLKARGLVSGLEWHDIVSSTNTVAADAAARGEPEVYAVLAEEQFAGRGRMGRTWIAPPATSLILSLMLRPRADVHVLGLLPLLTGLALVEAVDAFHPGLGASVKWPNDLLIQDRKAGGVLVESGPKESVIVGIGLNVDWRNVDRRSELSAATSLAEAMGWDVDRWDVLGTLLTAFEARYRTWHLQPAGFLPDYVRRCSTVGTSVRVKLVNGQVLTGHGANITRSGALVVGLPYGREQTVTAGDVEHVR